MSEAGRAEHVLSQRRELLGVYPNTPRQSGRLGAGLECVSVGVVRMSPDPLKGSQFGVKDCYLPPSHSAKLMARNHA